LSQPDPVNQFADVFQKKLSSSQPRKSASAKVETIQHCMHSAALTTFGTKTSKSHDWFKAKSTKMTPIVEAKRAAFAEYKLSPSEQNYHI